MTLSGLLLLAASGAQAAPNVVDQYTEQVPTAGGDKPSHQVPQDKPADKNSPLEGSEDGAAGLGTGESAPEGGTPPGDAASQNSSNSGSVAGTGDTTEPSRKQAATDGPDDSNNEGMGIAFPLILTFFLGLAVVFFFVRRQVGQ